MRSVITATIRLILIACSIFVAQLAEANAPACRHEILFLPQVHKFAVPGKTVQDDEEEAVLSQFRIASFLYANPQYPVFNESSGDKDRDWSDLKGALKPWVNYMARVFPNGRPPARYSELTQLQRKELLEQGGSGVIYKLGWIAKLHNVPRAGSALTELLNRVDEGLKGKDGDDEIPLDILELITTVRERMVLEDIRNYFIANPKQKKIVLVFGAGHDFRRHRDLFRPQCIKRQQLGHR